LINNKIIMLAVTARQLQTYFKRNVAQTSSILMVSAEPFTASRQTMDIGTERRRIHSTVVQNGDVAEAAIAPPALKTSTLGNRFLVTVEATVSKIFPAGFCWQTASIVAANQGYAPDTLNFALTTGFGDGMGVLTGHFLYYAGKKSILGEQSRINVNREFQNGVLLGTAAFFSGTAWQPIVNVLQGANLPFNQVFLGTWAGCGAAFYVGLRIARTILSGPCKYIAEPTYENSKNDMSLSAAVGGATGFFVGTDAAYLPQQNFLIDIVGIQPGVPDITGCAIAGTSTALGFMTTQSTFNLAYPAGKLWND
jgi:hypothetical protein